jgi:hypothetical protein
MGIASIIELVINEAIDVVPRLSQLFAEWHALGDRDPTKEEFAAIMQRIGIAEDRIDAAWAARHAGG